MVFAKIGCVSESKSAVKQMKIKARFSRFYFAFHSTCINFAAMFKNIMLVALGGAVGSVARYLVSRALNGTLLAAFPLGTMTANVLGCFVIGLVCGMADGDGAPVGPDLKLLLTVGFCGGFTTFSTFMNETLALARGGEALAPALYVGASVALGLLAVVGGYQLVKLI